jgi:MFS family permease
MARACVFFTAYAASLSPTALLTILTLVNTLNYVDRGIVPGAFDSLGLFIRSDLGVVSTDVQIGMLQSFYIVGYALASVSFGHLVHYFGAFQLVAAGLTIWIAAVMLCAVAPHFWVLVLGRVLSGVGEGSFQTVVPPYIDDHAPPAKRGLWLAVFFCAIPVGTALGNVYGGLLSSALSWRWAFALEGFAMVPAVALLWHLPVLRAGAPPPAPAAPGAPASLPSTPRAAAGDDGGAHSNASLAAAAAAVGDAPAALLLAAASPLRLALAPLTPRAGTGASGGAPDAAAPPLLLQDDGAEGDGDGGAQPAPSFFDELRLLLLDPLFMTITMGYAGFAAVLAGLGSFGPAIVLVRAAAKKAHSPRRRARPPHQKTQPAPPPPPSPFFFRRVSASCLTRRRRACFLAFACRLRVL